MAKKFIDAEKYREEFMTAVYAECADDDTNNRANRIIDDFDDLPAADVQEVRHGKWVECDYKKLEHGFIETFPNEGVCCSNCRTAFRKRDLWVKNYCPNCGARMDGEE